MKTILYTTGGHHGHDNVVVVFTSTISYDLKLSCT